MFAPILKDALSALKDIASDLGIKLDDLTPELLDTYITDCFTNARLPNTSDECFAPTVNISFTCLLTCLKIYAS